MIQAANVGIGISGKEGLQAVNASDFAVARFRFLKRLLLLHGRYNYKRISKVILYSFYKNIVITLCTFLYNFFNLQSGTSLFETWIYASFNISCALPIIGIGILDKDVSEDLVLAIPELYVEGRRNIYLAAPR